MGFDQDLTNAATKCSPVTISPSTGDTPLDVFLSTTQAGGHIFYRLGNTSSPPAHDGDNAISPTVRIGGVSASIHIGGTQEKFLTALCYVGGLLDSDITTGDYTYGGPPG
jgi:hypothetical protein